VKTPDSHKHCIAEAGIDAKRKIPRGEVVGEMISLSVNTEAQLPDVLLNRYPSFARMKR